MLINGTKLFIYTTSCFLPYKEVGVMSSAQSTQEHSMVPDVRIKIQFINVRLFSGTTTTVAKHLILSLVTSHFIITSWNGLGSSSSL
jgi:tetrahydromethanopterin S-methyltransferase subunit F